jgi:YD repeat-containing protein
VNPNKELWSAPPAAAPAATLPPAALPDPALDFPELAKDFRLAADAIVPGRVTSSVSMSEDGSRTAAIEYGVWSWVRTGPAIGKWNPPIHALNFLPNQRGLLRVFDASGAELFRDALPAEGMFEVSTGRDAHTIWCWPTSWFARGMAGAVWLPVDEAAHTLYRIELSTRSAAAISFPDAIADCAVSVCGRILISCWDGRLYLLDDAGNLVASHDAGGPARLTWRQDGALAVARAPLAASCCGSTKTGTWRGAERFL